MRKFYRYNVLIVVVALGMITCSIYSVLLTHIASLPQQSYGSSVEALKTGEMFWESISHHFVTMFHY